MADVFISYAEPDGDVAEQIGGILPGFGYTTWYYGRDSVPGRLHLEMTQNQIDEAAVFVAVVSRAAFESDFVFPEILHAAAARKTVIPVLKDVTYADLETEKPRWAQAFGFATAVEWKDGEKALLKIAAGIQGLLGERSRPKIDINAQDEHGYTALTIGIKACDETDAEDVRKRTEIVCLLLDNGADPNLATFDGTTPLALAREKSLTQIEELLREAGAEE